jgi:hypothetical protein
VRWRRSGIAAKGAVGECAGHDVEIGGESPDLEPQQGESNIDEARARPSGTRGSSASVTRPVPQPMSITVASDLMPVNRASTSEAHDCCGPLVWSYVRASQGVPIAATYALATRFDSPLGALTPMNDAFRRMTLQGNRRNLPKCLVFRM